MIKFVGGYFWSLGDREFVPTALRVASIVGSILFAINHGWALLQGEMSGDRWLATCMTYIVPYMVNIHGQYISRSRLRQLVPPVEPAIATSQTLQQIPSP